MCAMLGTISRAKKKPLRIKKRDGEGITEGTNKKTKGKETGKEEEQCLQIIFPITFLPLNHFSPIAFYFLHCIGSN